MARAHRAIGANREQHPVTHALLQPVQSHAETPHGEARPAPPRLALRPLRLHFPGGASSVPEGSAHPSAEAPSYGTALPNPSSWPSRTLLQPLTGTRIARQSTYRSSRSACGPWRAAAQAGAAAQAETPGSPLTGTSRTNCPFRAPRRLNPGARLPLAVAGAGQSRAAPPRPARALRRVTCALAAPNQSAAAAAGGGTLRNGRWRRAEWRRGQEAGAPEAGAPEAGARRSSARRGGWGEGGCVNSRRRSSTRRSAPPLVAGRPGPASGEPAAFRAVRETPPSF